MLISPAYAQAGGSGSDIFLQLMPLVLIFVVFYFLLIRPQQKRQKEHRNMVANLSRGDEIVTTGGIKGKITKVLDDSDIKVEIAEGVQVTIVRATVTDVLNKTEPRKDEK